MHLPYQTLRFVLRVAILAAAVAAWTGPARADDNEPIKTKELLTNPQRFWARAFVFSDVLVEHAGSDAKRLGKQKAYPFKTKELGECYVDESVVDVLNRLETGKGYIFSGTVYQQKGGLFRAPAFFVVVDGVITPMSRLKALGPEIQTALETGATNDPTVVCFSKLERILSGAQSRLLSYSKKEGVPWKDLFDRGSPEFDKTSQAIRNSLYEFESETKTPALEYFVELLTSFLVLREGGLAAAPAAEPQAVERSVDAHPPAGEPAIATESPTTTTETVVEPEAQARPAVKEDKKTARKKAAAKAEPKEAQEPAAMPEPVPSSSAPKAEPEAAPAALTPPPEPAHQDSSPPPAKHIGAPAPATTPSTNEPAAKAPANAPVSTPPAPAKNDLSSEAADMPVPLR